MDRQKETNDKEKSFLDTLGPGLITGAADDDPSGISTYSTAGAAYGQREGSKHGNRCGTRRRWKRLIL
jgi:Mn2+/Fe2+ NRAMP family transporter